MVLKSYYLIYVINLSNINLTMFHCIFKLVGLKGGSSTAMYIQMTTFNWLGAVSHHPQIFFSMTFDLKIN